MGTGLPRQYARTRRFTLGTPHAFEVSPDGQRVVFLRSRRGDDPVNCLWEFSVTSGAERLIVDPGDVTGELPPEELVRRERAREQSSGITEYAADRPIAVPEGPDVTYGLPEHVAAESMGRYRGFWWAPDGSRILAARVDTAQVQRWCIGDPANPAKPPTEIAYPAAGTPNADVTLWVFGVAGERIAVEWDRESFEYVVAADWSAPEPLVAVQSRSQRTIRVLTVDPLTGATDVRREDTDPCWTQLVPGVPAFTASGALVWTADLGSPTTTWSRPTRCACPRR